MDSCANTCQRMAPVDPESPIVTAAEKLACQLIDVPEFQAFVRLEREVRLDPDASEILAHMNGYGDPCGENLSAEGWGERLEDLPVMKSFRGAEAQVRDLLRAVEQIIGEAAGVPFAENAKPQACG